MNRLKIFLIAFAVSYALNINSQTLQLDSLKLALQGAKHDTTRCSILNAMIEAEDNDSIWHGYNKKMLQLTENNLKLISLNGHLKKYFIKRKGDALYNEGYYFNFREPNKAIAYYLNSIKFHNSAKNPTGVSSCFNDLGHIYASLGNPDKALESYLTALNIKDESAESDKGTTLNNIGQLYYEQANAVEALRYYNLALALFQKNKNKKLIAISFTNIGTAQLALGDIPKAVNNLKSALEIATELGDSQTMAYSLSNLAALYSRQGDKKVGLEFYKKSLIEQKKIGDTKGICGVLNNIGAMYYALSDTLMALNYYNQSLTIAVNNKYIADEARAFSNIGTLYAKYGYPDKGLKYQMKALKIFEIIRDNEGIANALDDIGTIYAEMQSLSESLKFLSRSLKLSKELGYPELIESAAKKLSIIYNKQGNYKKALENYTLFIRMRDSINSIANNKASIKSQLNFEYEKKEIAERIRREEEKKVNQAMLAESAAKLKHEKTMAFVLYGGMGLVLVFAGFMFNRFKITQKQKHIIEIKEKETQQQKHLIEEKHKEITDSINYAERIQRSFLATTALLDDNLKDHFVFFRPKDVVSGDFYWAYELPSKNFVLVTADSTGHGVPGAIMSLLNITSLEKAVEHNTIPSDILNHTRKIIIERLKKDGSPDGGKDGMDCSLVSFDFKNNKLTYSSANNPVWIIRGNEILECNPDKMPVGKHDRDTVSFTQNNIDLKTGDVVYTLTDGFPDQFGGPKGKKFMYKKLKELLLTMADLPMSDQKEKLSDVFNNWKGNLEQVDDVTIIGVRV